MNRYRVIVTVLIGIISFHLNAQTSKSLSTASFIEPYKLEVTYNKTTYLVFPTGITSIDRGSQDILVQKSNGVENIIRVKADVKNFEETNLTVITNDGKLYSFIVRFSSNPAYLNVDLGRAIISNPADAPEKESAIHPSPYMSEASLKAYASKAAGGQPNIHSLSDESSKMTLALIGFYIKDNTMFCRLKIENNSRINYDIEQLRFYIRDKKESKRTSTQEIEIHPVYILGDTAVVKGNESETLVIAVPKFTIPDGKNLAIEIMERNGGRHLALKVKNRHVLRARGL